MKDRVRLRDKRFAEAPGSSFNDRSCRAAILLAGVAAIVAGLLIYATARDLTRSGLIPDAWQIPSVHLFGTAAHWLPSLLHSFAFSLFTAAALWPCRRSVLLGGCVAWATINVLFELGQHPTTNLSLATYVVEVAGQHSWGTSLARYFAGGTFALSDIAAAVAGALFAALLLLAVFDHSSVKYQHD